MKVGILTVVCVSLLFGCTTVSQKIDFDAKSNDAFPMIVAGGIEAPEGSYRSFGFHRVDVTKAMFLSDSFEVTFASGAVFAGNEFKRPPQINTSYRFAGAPVKPGDYAIVYQLDSSLLSGRTFNHIECFSLGATVFRIKTGQINILPVVNIRDKGEKGRTAIESQVKSVLQEYPRMSAPITFVDPIGTATFPTPPRTANKKSCGSAGAFSWAPSNRSII